jgi:cytochrome c5
MTPSNRRLPPAVRRSATLMVTALACGLSNVLRAEDAFAIGGQLVDTVCTTCHALAPITGTRDGPVGWKATVYRMIGSGAQVQSKAEVERIVEYLSTADGPSAGTMRTGKLPPGAAIISDGEKPAGEDADLPAGAGADQVRNYCSTCHDLGRIVATRRSRSSWQHYTNSMLVRADVPTTPELTQSIALYLTQYFGIAGDK